MEEIIKIGQSNYINQTLWFVLIVFVCLCGYYLVNIGNRYIERSKRISFDSKLIQKLVKGAISLTIIFLLLNKIPILSRVLTMAIIAAVLSYIMNPFVDKLEERGIKRILGVGIVYIGAFLVITILGIVVFPKILLELRNLIMTLPSYLERLNEHVSSIIDVITENSSYESVEKIRMTFNSAIDNFTDEVIDWISVSVTKTTVYLTDFVQNIISVVLNIMLVLIMTFYFSVDKNRYTGMIKKFIPNSVNSDISYLYTEINTILSEFIRGRFLLAVFVGVFTTILLLILGIDFAIIIGIITCIADIIPYIGPLLGFIPAFLFALIESPFKALIVAVFYVIIQWMENNILAPKIIGDSMGLDPLFIFLSIIIGGGIFGVWGMIVSVPVAAIGMILIKFGIDKYKERGKKS